MEKVILQDLQCEYPNRVRLIPAGSEGVYDVYGAHGTVTQEGSPVTAAAINQIQDIAEAALAGKADAVQGVYYGEDNNAADLAERPVTVTEGLVLEAGVSIRVHFANGVTVRGATLNVNGTGAVPMKYRGANFSGNIRANDVIDFVYDGTNWAVIGQFDTDSLVTQLPKSDDVNYHLLCSSSGDIAGATSYATKNAAFTANPATGVLSATAFQEDDTLLADKYAAKAAQTLPTYGANNSQTSPATVTEGEVFTSVTQTMGYWNIHEAPAHMRILWHTFGGTLVLMNGVEAMNLTIFKADGTKTTGPSVTCASAGGMSNFGYFVLDVYKTSATDAIVMVSPEYPDY